MNMKKSHPIQTHAYENYDITTNLSLASDTINCNSDGNVR